MAVRGGAKESKRETSRPTKMGLKVPTAYKLFQEMRQNHRKVEEAGLTRKAMKRLIGEEWRRMTPGERSPYQAGARFESKRRDMEVQYRLLQETGGGINRYFLKSTQAPGSKHAAALVRTESDSAALKQTGGGIAKYCVASVANRTALEDAVSQYTEDKDQSSLEHEETESSLLLPQCNGPSKIFVHTEADTQACSGAKCGNDEPGTDSEEGHANNQDDEEEEEQEAKRIPQPAPELISSELTATEQTQDVLAPGPAVSSTAVPRSAQTSAPNRVEHANSPCWRPPRPTFECHVLNRSVAASLESIPDPTSPEQKCLRQKPRQPAPELISSELTATEQTQEPPEPAVSSTAVPRSAQTSAPHRAEDANFPGWRPPRPTFECQVLNRSVAASLESIPDPTSPEPCEAQPGEDGESPPPHRQESVASEDPESPFPGPTQMWGGGSPLARRLSSATTLALDQAPDDPHVAPSARPRARKRSRSLSISPTLSFHLESQGVT